ncbi:hypothetical protein [Paracoccus sp. DMF-8]|uniref:hypothetical protein n=1 Tax=Paracoccus sp. DMF-8 TaxID=3019445 RepID=UPI0032048843
MDWLTKFPTISDGTLRNLKKAIDDGFREFTRGYGDAIEGFFRRWTLLIWSERLMTRTPWIIVFIVILLIVWLPAAISAS